MKSKRLILLAFCITSQLVLADIPPSIEAYLTKNAPNIRKSLPASYAAVELITMAQRMAELLIKRYKNILNLKVKQSEVHDEITKHILFKIFTQPDISINITDNLLIDKLLKSFSGNIIGNILRINYENISVPLVVSVHPNFISLKVLGAPVKLDVEPPVSDPKSCFWLRYDLTNYQATLEWLGTMESACPITAEKQGEFLLSLAESLARTMEAKQIKLQDEARILCEKNQLTAKFHTLRIFQNKPNWYVAHGFKPKNKEMELLMASERQFLLDLKLSRIKELLKVHESKKNLASSLSVYKEQELKFAQSKQASDSFADFMSWLWESDCEAYLKVYKLLYKEMPIISPALSDVVPELAKDLS